MKISQLMDRLDRIRAEHGDVEVAILDGFNGGGDPRIVNFGPVAVDIASDPRDSGNIETREGIVVLLGHGF